MTERGILDRGGFLIKPLPFKPSILAEHLKKENCDLYVFGVKSERSKKGGEYKKFNLLITPGPILVPGMRLIGKKLFPPQVIVYRKLITQLYLGKEIREGLESMFHGASCDAAKFDTDFLEMLNGEDPE